MTFPSLNYIPMILEYGKLLSLPSWSPIQPIGTELTVGPVDVLRTVRAITELLGFSFELPTSDRSRVYPHDHPDIFFAAIVVVAAKLCFPIQQSENGTSVQGAYTSFRLDWKRWAEILDASDISAEPTDLEATFGDVSAEDIISMTDDELEKYFQYIAILSNAKSK